MDQNDYSKTKKPHSKFRFTCFSSKELPKVVISYAGPSSNFKIPELKSSASSSKLNKGSAKTPAQPRAPQTPEQKAMNDLFKKIQHKDSQKIFAQPVKEEFAPGYFNVISNPMDLSTIRYKMTHEENYNLSNFKEDVILMITNCMTYNPETSVFYDEAAKLFKYFKTIFKQTKNHLNGVQVAPTTNSSYSRTFSAGGQIVHKAITSLPIPVQVKSFVKKESPLYVQPKPIQLKERMIAFRQLSTPNPISTAIGEDQRFSVFLEVIRRNEKLRNNLNRLKQEFSVDVMNDAIREMAVLTPEYNLDQNEIDQALQSTEGGMQSFGVVDAPIDEYSLQQLVSQIPQLNLSYFQQTEAVSDPNIVSLRLLFFYQNMLKYWSDPQLDNAKRITLKQIENKISNQILTIKPSYLMKERDQTAMLYLQKSVKPV